MAIRTQHSEVFATMVTPVAVAMVHLQDQGPSVPARTHPAQFALLFEDAQFQQLVLEVCPVGVGTVLDQDLPFKIPHAVSVRVSGIFSPRPVTRAESQAFDMWRQSPVALPAFEIQKLATMTQGPGLLNGGCEFDIGPCSGSAHVKGDYY